MARYCIGQLANSSSVVLKFLQTGMSLLAVAATASLGAVFFLVAPHSGNEMAGVVDAICTLRFQPANNTTCALVI